MNKHLVEFFKDEIANNSYYDGIRTFADEKGIDTNDCAEIICSEFENVIDDFAIYRFIDAVEDYLAGTDISEYEDLYEVISDMWDEDYFENY